MSAPVVVWVLARPGDPGLHLLEPPPEGVRFVVGWEPDAFDGAPAPDALLDCWAGPTRLVAALRRAPGVRWIHARSAGLDSVLVPEVVAHPAVLTNGRGAFSAALAEFVLAALLFFAKDLRRLVAQQAAGAWEPFEMERLEGRGVGIVGYGDIGRAVAARLRPLGVKVMALRRRPELSLGDELVSETVPPERLLDLMARSDDVVVAAPLTPQTQGLVGREAIAAMKRTAVLVNVGRGPVVDEAALVEALEQGRIRGAALDVCETEPPPSESPL
jgi:phosphoglycerate dehydrogenase-like enzyme